MAVPTYRLDLAYDGSGFHGYARQPEVRTVQGELEGALFKLVGAVATEVAGRTDAGVHAHGQVVSFSADGELDTEHLVRSLNGMLGPELVVWNARQEADGFSARFSARARTYRYSVLNRPLPDPFLRHTTWHLAHELSRDAMNEAARFFVGEHDFASFCRSADGRSTVRQVLAAGWGGAEPNLVSFEITAGSFCHQMVRSVVAVCVEVGRGRLPVWEVPAIIEARDRAATRGAAPPHGLTLWKVEY
jgi:tRNA pseudouridine38-40 synthase